MKIRVYLVPSLIAAGLLPSKADAAPIAGMVEKKQTPTVFERLRVRHVYTLAGHSSHASHASHASHTSSAGSTYLPPGDYGTSNDAAPDPQPRYKAPSDTYRAAPTSPSVYAPIQPPAQTPPASIYGNSAQTPPDLKVLPGNSDKFRRIVIQVQTGLIAFGYYPGPVTGQVDIATKAGLSKMQDAYGLKVTGTVTPQVLTALGISAN